MSIEKLSPRMRNCIMSLQSESVVSIECKADNKNNTVSFLSRILKSFK